MKCPHCATELRYRDRSGKRCNSCQHRFALEPRTNRLKLHDLRLRDLAQKLSSGGQYYYSVDQLRYAAGRKLLQPASALAKAGGCVFQFFVFGFILTIGSFVFGDLLFATLWANALLLLPLLMLFLGAIMIVWVLTADRRRYPPFPITAEQFSREVLKPYHETYDEPLPGFLGGQKRPQLRPDLPAPSDLRGALVCPDAAIRACLLANDLPGRFGLALLPAAGPFDVAAQTHLEALRQHPQQLPLLLLHDASPAGCLLATHVVNHLGLGAAGERRVIDLGLRPRTVIKHKLMTLKAKPDATLLQQLQQAGKLAPEELAWLAAGNYTPIAALAPARLMAIIERVRLRPLAAPEPEPEPEPEQLARAIGFMSWPQG
ncbi:MAG: hypothetical protein EI684_06080 [Candidatus Viridilinea halotolerans]|uniref:Uncharacterized protein n=1 Tax=Candidatus Viridilinea halotolerans TaxID=2491704 RepID=A0A426U4L2_9CHLR|nr:MAG: hypothetical protein EI684_06080 [Candidatus Viridilinea halotolerans]